MSTLTEVGAVDATAAAVLALTRAAPEPESRRAIEAGLQWLESAVCPEGGWGITAGADFRCYSTTAALRAFVGAERLDDEVVTRAVRRLAGANDDGVWSEADHAGSVALTAIVVRLLADITKATGLYAGEVSAGASWLLAMAAPTRLWGVGSLLGEHEEVEARVAGELRRVDYRHCPRPQAVAALIAAGESQRSEVVSATKLLCRASMRRQYGEVCGGTETGKATSWALHDVTLAFGAFRDDLRRRPEVLAVWAGRRRVVYSNGEHGRLQTAARRHWPAFAGGLLVVAAFALYNALLDLESVGSWVGVLLVGVVTTLVSEFVGSRLWPRE